MSKSFRHVRLVALFGLNATSLILGLSIPAFYEWTGSDQSRPSPLLWQIPMGTVVIALVICAVLPWLPISQIETKSPNSDRRIRFTVRRLLGMTVVVAGLIAAGSRFPHGTASLVCLAVLLNLVRIAIRNTTGRVSAITLIACMVFPYAWIITYAERDRISAFVMQQSATWPMYFPSNYAVYYLGIDHRSSAWFASLLTAIEFAVGSWCVVRSVKLTIVFCIWAMLTSAMGSLVFYQLCIF
ncbi:MAG: hypothetical protein AAF539_10545 [Planctomycetota bacterium]